MFSYGTKPRFFPLSLFPFCYSKIHLYTLSNQNFLRYTAILFFSMLQNHPSAFHNSATIYQHHNLSKDDFFFRRPHFIFVFPVSSLFHWLLDKKKWPALIFFQYYYRHWECTPKTFHFFEPTCFSFFSLTLAARAPNFSSACCYSRFFSARSKWRPPFVQSSI